MVYKRQAEEMISQDHITPSSNQNGRVSMLKARGFNPFQPSDAKWRHIFHLSLICVSFAQ
jgi:hypothetical protein